LADGVAFHDRFAADGFTLLQFGGSPRLDAALVAASDRLGVPLRTISCAGPGRHSLYGADLVLIRPDQHVAWRGDAPPDDCDALLRRVTGAT
jgi:hypothetical protein